MIAAVENPVSQSLRRSYLQWQRPIGAAYECIFNVPRRIAISGSPTAGMVGLITLLAALAALAIAVIVPISWFLVAQAHLRAEVDIHAQLYATRVAEEARRNPTLWNALAGGPTDVSLNDLEIARPPAEAPSAVAERRRVFSATGRTIIDTDVLILPPWPPLISRLDVTDGDTVLGEVDVARSLRPALNATAIVTGLSSCLGLLVFLLLRVAPLRMLAAAVDHASFVSAHDLLTGLPNRRVFHDRLEHALAQAHREGGMISVFYMDLDNFKTINDLFGHPAGDATLRAVAERLRSCLRASDTLARLGGDEFAVIQPMLRRVEDAEALGDRLLAAIDPPIDFDEKMLQVGISIGVTLSEIGASNQPDQLMKQADIALYQAKLGGRGRFCFFAADMNARLHERHAMETDLRAALSERSLILHYQPQVDLVTGEIIGTEALLRWNRPGHGMVLPDRFISLAEDTGLIVPLGLWALREACLRAITWPEHITIAVNVSPVQLRHPGFLQNVIDVLSQTGITPERLELELTEGILMQDSKESLTTLQRLRDRGVKFAMDDFGTGYSSLGYLQKFPFDKVKIDRSFISRLSQDPNADAIVRAIVGMTAALGVRTIAEGVETNTQADALRAHGCFEAQGYLFSRPVSGEAFDALVIAGTASLAAPSSMGPCIDAMLSSIAPRFTVEPALLSL